MEQQRAPVIVFRDYLGMESETFIYAQACALERYGAFFAGSRVAGQLPRRGCGEVVIGGPSLPGVVREGLFKCSSVSPRLDRYISRITPALIHAHFGPDGAIVGPFAVRRGVPLVVTFHGADATLRRESCNHPSLTVRIYWRRREWLTRHAALSIAVSDYIRDRLIEQGFPPDRVIRHYIGIDLETFRPDPQIPREPMVLFVGRLVEKKGCALLIEAMTDVQGCSPQAGLVVIGDGPLRQELSRLAVAKRVRAEFLGWQAPHVVRAWMQRATVFCVPSIRARSGDTEGFGMVFAEAAALGTPVASFASGGIRESVLDGITGLLAPEKDIRALAQNLRAILARPDLREELGRAGIRRVHELFDIRKQTRKLEYFYDAVRRGDLADPNGS